MDVDELGALSRSVGEALFARRWVLVTAESCTGGWIAKCVTDVPGSSDWFDRAFVSYSNPAKQEMLGVKPRSLERFGAVSGEVVAEMISGALTRSTAQVAVAVSGVAGPAGGSPEKPVGLVWCGWGVQGAQPDVQAFHFDGDREAVRRQTVAVALEGLLRVAAVG